MSRKRQVLFVQGGGKGAHDEWDDQLVASLRAKLGHDYEVHYPRMPNEAEPEAAAWVAALERAFDSLGQNAILVAHSIGATILLKALEEQSSSRSFAGIFLIAAPFVGEGGWSAELLQLPSPLGPHLPQAVPIHFFQGLDDETAPPSHVDLYARALPRAVVHRLKGRDHQLGGDMSEVAAAILALPGARQ